MKKGFSNASAPDRLAAEMFIGTGEPTTEKKTSKQPTQKKTAPEREQKTDKKASPKMVNIEDIVLERGKLLTFDDNGLCHIVDEKKTARAQLLMRPSIKEGLQNLAKKRGTSLNDLLDEIVTEYLKGNK